MSNSLNKYYVYAYYQFSRVFYIGKGCGTRFNNKTVRSVEFTDKINTNNWYRRKLVINLSEEDSYEIEELLIDMIGLDNLVNKVPGGTDKYKLGRNMKGKNNPRYGIKISDETKYKLKKSHDRRYEIKGIIFENSDDAALYFNRHRETILRWVKKGLYNSKIIK